MQPFVPFSEFIYGEDSFICVSDEKNHAVTTQNIMQCNVKGWDSVLLSKFYCAVYQMWMISVHI